VHAATAASTTTTPAPAGRSSAAKAATANGSNRDKLEAAVLTQLADLYRDGELVRQARISCQSRGSRSTQYAAGPTSPSNPAIDEPAVSPTAKLMTMASRLSGDRPSRRFRHVLRLHHQPAVRVNRVPRRQEVGRELLVTRVLLK
jgi:hypothetical protein